jgi:anti-anti-sigma regulatory factor
MSGNSAATCSIMLEGEWLTDKAADSLKFLAGKLAQLLEADPGPDEAEIDMAGVADLDACGCQLLVVFLENLRRHGIVPILCSIPQQVMDRIDLLGFSDAFASPEQPKTDLHDEFNYGK